MSRTLHGEEYLDTFEINDRVSFMSPFGERIQGVVVRVYASRTLYHVQGDDGERYEVSMPDDAMRKVTTLT